MATITPTTATSGSLQVATGQTYRGPFVIMTVLFFMRGFMTVWNDVLIPRFKEAFALNYFQAMLVQFAFFGAYCIGSHPVWAFCRKVAAEFSDETRCQRRAIQQ